MIVEVGEDYVRVLEADGVKNKQVVERNWDKQAVYDKLNANTMILLDFKIPDNQLLVTTREKSIGLKYDYFTIFELAMIRFNRLFGKKMQQTKKNPNVTPKLVDCSELMARNIHILKGWDVKAIMNYSRFEQFTPQDIVTLYLKLKLLNQV